MNSNFIKKLTKKESVDNVGFKKATAPNNLMVHLAIILYNIHDGMTYRNFYSDFFFLIFKLRISLSRGHDSRKNNMLIVFINVLLENLNMKGVKMFSFEY